MSDGLDIALCSYDRSNSILEYAGAKNPLWIIRNKELIEYKATRKSIGGESTIKEGCFQNHRIEVKSGDHLYLFSDGYADQFGGPENKKLMKSRFSELMVEISDLNMEAQSEKLDSTLSNWMGKNEQVDDILVIGITL